MGSALGYIDSGRGQASHLFPAFKLLGPSHHTDEVLLPFLHFYHLCCLGDPAISSHDLTFSIMNSNRLPLLTIPFLQNSVGLCLWNPCCPNLSVIGQGGLQWPEVSQCCLFNAWSLLGLGLLLLLCFVL